MHPYNSNSDFQRILGLRSPGLVHALFLKRNGATLAGILQNSFRPANQSGLPLLEELTILVATHQVSALIDGRALFHWKRLFARSPPAIRAAWTPKQWDRHVGQRKGAVTDAGHRLRSLYNRLARRLDYPSLAAMRNWGQPRWRSLFRAIGCPQSLAGALTALVLDRDEMPSGPRTTHLYRRLGYQVGRQGRPDALGVLPVDVPTLKWGVQQLAATRCTPVITPGGMACKRCPVRRFCQAFREATSMRPAGRPTFIDLFAGPGGLCLGLTEAGMRLVLAVEKERHASDTLYLNHPEAAHGVILQRDVRTVLSNRKLINRLKEVAVLAGGPPCQAFSLARRHSRADVRHPSRLLVRDFVRAVRLLRPKIAVMENVLGLRNAASGRALERTLRAFSKARFAVDYLEINAADYGVPQNRRRVFFFAVNRRRFHDADGVLAGLLAEIRIRARARSPPSVSEALSGLPRIAPSEGGLVMKQNYVGRVSTYARRFLGPEPVIYNHQARPHNKRDLSIFRDMRWGEVAWQYEERRPGRIPYPLDSFSDKYRKIHPHRPSPTIPCHLHRDANSYVHPFVPRGITPREAARLQSFPDDYAFLGGFGPSFIQIGNAVPPLLAESLGRAILKSLH